MSDLGTTPLYSIFAWYRICVEVAGQEWVPIVANGQPLLLLFSFRLPIRHLYMWHVNVSKSHAIIVVMDVQCSHNYQCIHHK